MADRISSALTESSSLMKPSSSKRMVANQSSSAWLVMTPSKFSLWNMPIFARTSAAAAGGR
jgi:hypothetical protein